MKTTDGILLRRLTNAPSALLILFTCITGFDLCLRPESQNGDESRLKKPLTWALHAIVLWPLLVGRALLAVDSVRPSKLDERNMTENALLVQAEYHAASNIAIYVFLAFRSRSIASLIRDTLAVLAAHHVTTDDDRITVKIVWKLWTVSGVLIMATIAYGILQFKMTFLMDDSNNFALFSHNSVSFWKLVYVVFELYSIYGSLTMFVVQVTLCVQLVLLTCHIDLFRSDHGVQSLWPSSCQSDTTTSSSRGHHIKLDFPATQLTAGVLYTRQKRHNEICTLVTKTNRVFGAATLIWICDFTFTAIFQIRSIVNVQLNSDVIYGSRIIATLVLNTVVFFGVCSLIINTNSKAN